MNNVSAIKLKFQKEMYLTLQKRCVGIKEFKDFVNQDNQQLLIDSCGDQRGEGENEQ